MITAENGPVPRLILSESLPKLLFDLAHVLYAGQGVAHQLSEGQSAWNAEGV